MANRYWLGVSGDWTATANWSTTRYGAGGSAAPTSSDDVYILDGDIDITSNITAVAAQSIRIGGNFSASIGGSGTAMTVNTAACPITIENVATGKTIAIGADAAVTISGIVRIRSTGGGTVTLASGAAGVITTVRCGRQGRVIVSSSAAVTNLYSGGIRITAEPSSTAFTLLELRGGGNAVASHDIRRACTTLTVTNGAVARNYNSVAVTTANVESQGTVFHDSDGTVGTLNAFPAGVFKSGATAFAITNANIWQGSTTPPEGGRVTYTNTPEFYGDVG